MTYENYVNVVKMIKESFNVICVANISENQLENQGRCLESKICTSTPENCQTITITLVYFLYTFHTINPVKPGHFLGRGSKFKS